jgi:hypothetical protein
MVKGLWTVRPWGRATALTAGVLMVLTACGSGSDKEAKLEPRLQRLVPTETPAVSVTPRNGQPAEARQVTGKYFSMYVPANFQEKSVPQANGEQMVFFDAPSSKPASPVRVAVLGDSTSKATAIEQSYTLETAKKSEGAKGFTRSTLKWPGAQRAILLQWTVTPPGALSTDEPERHWQIMAQVNEHLVVGIIAVGPEGEFDTSGLAKIVETFRPHA